MQFSVLLLVVVIVTLVVFVVVLVGVASGEEIFRHRLAKGVNLYDINT